MNEQQTPLDQIPSERLAIIGWDARERQDALRREADVIEQNLSVIRGELIRRGKLMQENAQGEEVRKKAEQEALVRRVLDQVSGTDKSVNRMNGQMPVVPSEGVTETKN